MKYILIMMLALTFVACSLEKVDQVDFPALETQAVQSVKKMDTTAVETGAKPEPSIVKAEVVVEKEVIKETETQIEVEVESGMEVTKAEQPVVKVLPKAGVQTSQGVKTEKSEPVTKAEKVMTEPIQVKVVAQPVQGKGEIRSEPKVSPKSGLMLKEVSGDVATGKKIAKKCMSCHTFDKGGKKKVGPNLFAIVGKARGTFPSFKYGSYLASVGGSWDETSLRAWVTDSKGVAKAAGKKTKMASQKIKDKKADDLIAYLKTLK